MTSGTPGSTALRLLADGGQLALVWLMIPVAILLFGLPLVLAIRGLVEIGAALFGG